MVQQQAGDRADNQGPIGRIGKAAALALAAMLAMTPAISQAQVTDWGGGYSTGVDSITTMSMQSASGRSASTEVTPAQNAVVQKCASMAALATANPKGGALRTKLLQIPEAPTEILRADIVAADRDVPEFCRVTGVVAPNIGFEVSLPTKNWNGKFMHYGCGGSCGQIYRPQLEEPLIRGYAVVASDMGHNAANNSSVFRWGNLQGMIDFGYRATHVATLAGKIVTEAYYEAPPKWSYYMGCSTGGVQGVIEAQRYPYDFNGILVAAPAYSSGPSYLEWAALADTDANGKPILDDTKLPMVRKAVIAACDGLDGYKDGLLQNPLACKWDPGVIVCKAGVDDKTCLTPAEVTVIRKIYAGPSDSKGNSLSYGYGGMPRGSEYLWAPTLVGVKASGKPASRLIQNDTSWGNGVYPAIVSQAGKPYDYDVDYKMGNIFGGSQTLGWLRYAGNPDLRRFRDNGGKMILYHGWDDNEVAPGASVDYYDLATATMGGEAKTKEFFRLFMMPGMAHCRRGPGGDAADYITALETWVEKGQAPDQIVAHHLVKEQNYLGLPRPRYPLPAGSFDRTRPVYAYPDIATYSGKGDPNVASSWVKQRRAAAK